MNSPRSLSITVLAAIAVLSARPAAAQACGADVDCGGDNICVEGACVDPNAKSADGTVEVRYSEDDAATGERLPVRYVARPIVLPHLVLRPDAGLTVLRFAGTFESDTGVGLGLGASIGLFDSLELSIAPIVLALAPDVDYGDIPFVARYRFLDGPAELGAELLLRIPTQTRFNLTPALIARFHLADFMAIDTGVGVSVTFADPDPVAGLVVPLRFSFQIIDMLFAGLDTGFLIANFDNPGDTIAIPLGFRAGFTLPGESGPLFDVIAGFDFPVFLVPASDNDKVFTDLYVFSLSFGFHFFL